ncbi:MAG: methyltransferase domain-containing protein, partial [Rhizomicrobium sp.]
MERPHIPWNPDAYLTFADQRTRPAAELLARVRMERPARAIDLGCGPGNSTALLAARWPDAVLEGLDSSDTMLAKARESGVAARWVEA